MYVGRPRSKSKPWPTADGRERNRHMFEYASVAAPAPLTPPLHRPLSPSAPASSAATSTPTCRLSERWSSPPCHSCNVRHSAAASLRVVGRARAATVSRIAPPFDPWGTRVLGCATGRLGARKGWRCAIVDEEVGAGQLKSDSKGHSVMQSFGQLAIIV